MNNIIDRLKSISFSDKDILQAVDNEANLLRYPELSEYSNIDQVLGPYDAAIILYETKEAYGHWVCIFKSSHDTLEFFDPYASKPDDELSKIPMHFRLMNNELIPHLTRLLYKSPYDVIYNEDRLQKLEHDVNTCGRHVAMRLVMREMPLAEYQELFEGINADDAVTMLTAFIR